MVLKKERVFKKSVKVRGKKRIFQLLIYADSSGFECSRRRDSIIISRIR